MPGLEISERDVEMVGAADREWWRDWQNYLDEAGFDPASREAELDFLDCGCRGTDWRCGHFGWRVAIVRAVS